MTSSRKSTDSTFTHARRLSLSRKHGRNQPGAGFMKDLALRCMTVYRNQNCGRSKTWPIRPVQEGMAGLLTTTSTDVSVPDPVVPPLYRLRSFRLAVQRTQYR